MDGRIIVFGAALALSLASALFIAGSIWWDRHVKDTFIDAQIDMPWYVKVCQWMLGK